MWNIINKIRNLIIQRQFSSEVSMKNRLLKATDKNLFSFTYTCESASMDNRKPSIRAFEYDTTTDRIDGITYAFYCDVYQNWTFLSSKKQENV